MLYILAHNIYIASTYNKQKADKPVGFMMEQLVYQQY